MSLSTDVIVTVMMGQAPAGLTTNTPEFLFCKGRQQGFEQLPLNQAGGNNCMGGEVWAAGFDYVNEYELTEWMETLPWQHPDFVVVLFQFEQDNGVTIWSPAKGVIQRSEAVR